MNRNAIRGLVTAVTRVSPTLSKIQLRLSHGLKYYPGQSIWISPLSEGLINKGITGFYQLSSCPEKALRMNQYEILAETNPLFDLIRGLGKVKTGDFLKIEGPIGAFWPLRVRPEESVVWISSVGKLGPYLSCVQSENFSRIRPRQVLLLVEMAHEETLPFREIFEAKGVTVVPCVNKPVRWVDGFMGSVSTFLKSGKLPLNFNQTRFFISAESPLLREIWTALVHEKKVPVNQITHEHQTQASESTAVRFRERNLGESKAA